LSLGPQWGPQASFFIFSGQLGRSRRNVHLADVSGSFDVKCRICGFAQPRLQDVDIREGEFDINLEFGPNLINGVVNESNISGYAVRLVNYWCQRKRGPKLAFVPKNGSFDGTVVEDACGCPSQAYKVRVQGSLPDSHVRDGRPNGEFVRLMVAPVTDTGHELPIGTVSALLQDYFTTTTTTTTTSTTTSSTTSTTSATTITMTTPTATTTETMVFDANLSFLLFNTTTETMTTTTYTLGRTLTVPAAPTTLVPPTRFTLIRGNVLMDLGSGNATEFASDPEVLAAVTDSIAALVGVPAEYVEVTITVVSRRLGEQDNVDDSGRRLAGGKVRIDYIIRLPDPVPNGISDARGVTSKLQANEAAGYLTTLISENVDARAGAGKYTVTVAQMSIPSVELIQVSTTTRTTTSTSSAPSPPAIAQPSDDGGSGAGAAVGATLGTLGVLGLGAGAGYFVYRRRNENANRVEAFADGSSLRKAAEVDEFDVDDDCPYQLSIFEELARKPPPLQ